ncbi:MAG: type II toxin-antitoxin system YafQ family toxin [Bacteroidales bacterium]|nr:type II toxin-antitoxin system YafQ family toxin [Bacteroidales bacterium]
MFSLESSTQFKKDYKALSAPDANLLETALEILAETGTLPYDPYLTYPLKGKFKDNMEAHIKPDMLLIWYEKVGNTIKLVRVGSHSKLFKK